MSSIKSIKRVRTLLLIYDTLALFIMHRVVAGDKYHIIESIEIALLGFILNLLLWSDWLYYKEASEEDRDINYNTFHFFGSVFVLFYSFVIHISFINDLLDKN